MAKEFKTLFGDAVHKSNNESGDWGGTKNGDKSFQGAEAGKSTGGRVDEVTYVDVAGAPSPGSKITPAEGPIAGKGSKD